jgi:predicted nucleic acid-binding protein
VEVRCWDASCWAAHLGREPGRFDRCRSVLKAGEDGRLKIVTSALALVEVIKLKSREPLPPEKEPTIRAYFKQPYIVIREVDRRVGELARELIWTHHVPQWDAVHVATALVTPGVVQLDTFDEGDLIKHSGKLGDPPLVIGYPPLIPEQLELGAEPGDEDVSPRA